VLFGRSWRFLSSHKPPLRCHLVRCSGISWSKRTEEFQVCIIHSGPFGRIHRIRLFCRPRYPRSGRKRLRPISVEIIMSHRCSHLGASKACRHTQRATMLWIKEGIGIYTAYARTSLVNSTRSNSRPIVGNGRDEQPTGLRHLLLIGEWESGSQSRQCRRINPAASNGAGSVT